MTTFASHPHAHVLTPFASPKKWELWVGRILSALPILMMLFSATMKLTHAPQMVSTWVNRLGWPESAMTPVALTEITCALLFALPRTAVLGAILVASYLGGAFAAHVRIDDARSGIVPIVLIVFAWLGLYLRDERVRALLPLRNLWRESRATAALRL
jgi:hypothetical protein